MKQHIRKEIDNLLKQAAEFSEAHPNIAPLISETSTDPDVKRLFEGTAFLTALIKEKIDDEFPEIVHELVRLCWPHYIRPLPSATIIRFTPLKTLDQSVVIPAGVYIDSIPVDGTACRFKTCQDVDLHPITLTDALWMRPLGKTASIKLVFQLHGINLSVWKPRSLRLFLAERYTNASDLYFLLNRCLNRIVVRPSGGGSEYFLPSENLNFSGLSTEEPLLPYPANSFSGYGIIQEYFLMPKKFLFFNLKGIENWNPQSSSSEFEVIFELNSDGSEVLEIDKNSFQLFAVPAINIFDHPGAPVLVDHKKAEYPVRPEGKNLSHYHIFSLDKVTGITRGTAEAVDFKAFHDFDNPDESVPVYNEVLRTSRARGIVDTFITLAHLEFMKSHVLSFELTCTNGDLPENLVAGDICMPTDSSPEFAEFHNLTPPTKSAPIDIQSNFMWKLLSHLVLNYTSISNKENFKELLKLYIPKNNNQGVALHRFKGIRDLKFQYVNRMITGIMMNGIQIDLKLRHDYFLSKGDMCLFGDVINVFLGMYAAINTFTRLTVEDLTSGDFYQWPERTGAHPLI